MSGDNSSDYMARRKVTGRLKLSNQTEEDTLQLLAEGYEKSEVSDMIGGKLSVVEIDNLLSVPLAQRRFQFIQQAKARADYEPQTPEECLTFSKRVLVKIAKESEDKHKIAAAAGLAKIAIDEREHEPKKVMAPAAGGDLDELKRAFGEKGSE